MSEMTTDDLLDEIERRIISDSHLLKSLTNLIDVFLSDDSDEPDPISDADTNDLLDELKERGVNILDQQQVEEAYEGLLRGDTVLAKRYLCYALTPTGGFDGIAHRVRQDLRRQAADAKRAGEACHNEKTA